MTTISAGWWLVGGAVPPVADALAAASSIGLVPVALAGALALLAAWRARHRDA